ncbi:hypothetical protein NDU88_000805 [Pleurodeles waltl]|uniref:Uncharacterized protein n=1 Tax=Pleurodeles waltl TaxID=8319 RepID=A0AAV7P4Y1_PLEWA|nr:hypothetical protein NDU88_000805 [Pleurodeles waltl]
MALYPPSRVHQAKAALGLKPQALSDLFWPGASHQPQPLPVPLPTGPTGVRRELRHSRSQSEVEARCLARPAVFGVFGMVFVAAVPGLHLPALPYVLRTLHPIIQQDRRWGKVQPPQTPRALGGYRISSRKGLEEATSLAARGSNEGSRGAAGELNGQTEACGGSSEGRKEPEKAVNTYKDFARAE